MPRRIIPEVNGYNKIDVIAFMKAKIRTNDVWARKACSVLFDQQTKLEKKNHISCGHNNSGFGRMDSPILTKISCKINQHRETADDLETLKRKLPRYAAQLICLAYDKDKYKSLKKQLDMYYKNTTPKLPF